MTYDQDPGFPDRDKPLVQVGPGYPTLELLVGSYDPYAPWGERGVTGLRGAGSTLTVMRSLGGPSRPAGLHGGV